MIGGDSGSVRSLARSVREHRQAVHDQAGALRSAQGVEWRSSAAAHFQAQLEQRAGDLAGVVGRFEHLEDALDRLADTIDERQRALLEAFQRAAAAFERTLDDVTDAAGDAVEAVEDAGRRTWEYADDAAGWARDHVRSLF
ncbi:hypothetical protein K8Z61_10745 [Nocardioides sp. TRM66260-LWL]|uniref:hypothetical protein n=1 Tax=Nocardioides sp. TRM66260-LWL TaxID=2874478 RepID=UPI001CC491B9|nr:hypothetical protein [Nocardioides sp. TRM66260-LWL]MBZ5734975.1 hypothetical protein [Nocardioides sp. TRM66260-LWL]